MFIGWKVFPQQKSNLIFLNVIIDPQLWIAEPHLGHTLKYHNLPPQPVSAFCLCKF